MHRGQRLHENFERPVDLDASKDTMEKSSIAVQQSSLVLCYGLLIGIK